MRQAQSCRGLNFPAVRFGSQRTGSQAAHYTRHAAWEKGRVSKWKISGAWTKDRKVWMPCQELKLTQSPRVGLRRRQSWATLGAGSGESWKLAKSKAPLQWKRYSKQNKAWEAKTKLFC